MKHRSLTVNAALNTTKTVLGIMFPLITYPYVSRVLGVDNLGIYNFSYSIVSYFILIAALGVATYGIREGTQYRDDPDKINSFVSELFTINMISTVVSYMLLAGCLFIGPLLGGYRIPILILSAEILFTTIGVSWVCNIYEDFLIIAIRTIAFQILSLILIFAFIRSEDDLYSYLGILIISSSGSNLFNYFYVRKKYCRFRLTTHIDWARHLKPILIIFTTAVAITIYVSSDMTMLGFMTDDHQVGLYGTAVKIYTIIKNILAAILMVMIPRFTLLFSGGDREVADSFFSRIFNVLTLIMLPVCTGLIAISDDIVHIISGEAFAGSALPLRLLSIAVVFSLYSYMYTQCVLIPVRREAIVFRATAVSALINIGLNFILIPVWGIMAAAITTIAAEAVTFIISYHYSRGIVSLKGIRRNLISVVTGSAAIMLVCVASSHIDAFILRVLCSVACSVIAYATVLLIMKNPVLFQLRDMLLKRD